MELDGCGFGVMCVVRRRNGVMDLMKEGVRVEVMDNLV
jgi:hypothetical protein